MLKLCYLSFGQHCKIAFEKLWHIFGKWLFCFINSHACYFGNLFIVYRSAKSVPAWPRSSPVTWAAEPSRSSSRSSSQTPSLTPSSRGAGQSTPCRYVNTCRHAIQSNPYLNNCPGSKALSTWPERSQRISWEHCPGLCILSWDSQAMWTNPNSALPFAFSLRMFKCPIGYQEIVHRLSPGALQLRFTAWTELVTIIQGHTTL